MTDANRDQCARQRKWFINGVLKCTASLVSVHTQDVLTYFTGSVDNRFRHHICLILRGLLRRKLSGRYERIAGERRCFTVS